MGGMMREDGFVSGWKDKYGTIHSTKEKADSKNREFDLYQEMYDFVENQHHIVLYPRSVEVAEYITRHYESIKRIMEKYGR